MEECQEPLVSDSIYDINLAQPQSLMNAGTLLRKARLRAGLSQRELARRAGTAQSLVSRIERSLTDPTTQGLERLLRAAGFDLRMQAVEGAVADTHMLTDVERILAMTPEERLIEVANINKFEHQVKRAVPSSS